MLPKNMIVNYCPKCGHSKKDNTEKNIEPKDIINDKDKDVNITKSEVYEDEKGRYVLDLEGKKIHFGNDDKPTKKDNSKKDANRKTNSYVGAIVALIIIILSVAFIVRAVWVYYAAWEEHNNFVERGCEPISFNQYGIGTTWRCP